MIGTIINGAAIVAGGIAGLTVARHLSPANQQAMKLVLALLTIYVGLSTTVKSFSDSFSRVMGQIGIMLLALILGNIVGKLLGIQRRLNRFGQYAKERFGKAGNVDQAKRLSEGFITCALLFCVGPMAILGAVQDGLTGNYQTLAVKGLMDGLATMAFVATFGWGCILAVIPVVAYQGTITLLAKALTPYLQDPLLLNSVNAVGGLLVFCIAMIILEIKKVPVADYLPSLAFAPLLTWLWM